MKLKGYNIYGPIVPFSDLDSYPTHIAKYGKGGYMALASLNDRNAIPEERLEEGMLVFIVNDNTNIHFYQYLKGKWESAKFSNEITQSSSLEDFAQTSAPGNITIYENKLYQTIINEDGEKEVVPVPIYEVKDTEARKVYSGMFSGESSDFNKDSDISLNCGTVDKNLVLSNKVVLKYAGKTITPEKTDSSISLPSKNGVLALEEDVELKTASLQKLLNTAQAEINKHGEKLELFRLEENMYKDGSNIHNYTAFYDSSKYKKFLTISRDSETASKGMLLYITGIVEGRAFTEILGISIAISIAGDKVYYLNGKEGTDESPLWYYASTSDRIFIYVKEGVSFSAKVLQKTISNDDVNKITWYGNDVLPVYKSAIESDGKILKRTTSFAETSKTTVNQLVPKVEVLSYFDDLGNGINKTEILDVENFNTFIINSNGHKISSSDGDLVFKINKVSEDLEKNLALKFIATKPNEFNYFTLKYDGNEVLKLEDLDLQDGEGIYVTYNNSGTWSYYRESSLPAHDETLQTVIIDGVPSLSVAQSSNEEKIYEVNFTTLSDPDSGIKIYVDSNGKISLEIPEDAGVLMIDVTGLYLKAHSIDSEVTTNLVLKSIKSSSATEFKQGKTLKLIFRCSNNYSVKFEASTAFAAFSTNGHFYGCEQSGDAVTDIYTEGWRYRSYLPDNTLEFGSPSNNKISGTTVEVLSVLDEAENLGWIYYSTDYIPQITLEEIKVMTDYIKDEFKIE